MPHPVVVNDDDVELDLLAALERVDNSPLAVGGAVGHFFNTAVALNATCLSKPDRSIWRRKREKGHASREIVSFSAKCRPSQPRTEMRELD